MLSESFQQEKRVRQKWLHSIRKSDRDEREGDSNEDLRRGLLSYGQLFHGL